MKNKPARGFKQLIGKTIKKIDSSSINCVHIETECGLCVTIHAEEMTSFDIGIIECGNYWNEKQPKE